MVERLKIAVEKARAQREKAVIGAAPAAPRATGPVATPEHHTEETKPDTAVRTKPDEALRANAWNSLEQIELDPRQLARNRIVTQDKQDPAHIAFDVLRTRMLGAFEKHGWTRLGITSPHKGCGKTFVAANLALSLARQANSCTILMDMDLRNPSVAKVLGLKKMNPEPARWFLSGQVPPKSFLRRYGANLALGLSSGQLRDSAELILEPSTARALDAMHAELMPDVVIYDLPPLLSCDDALGFLPQLDAVLLIIGGGITKPGDVTECERLLQDQCPILGVLLNKAEGADLKQYQYY